MKFSGRLRSAGISSLIFAEDSVDLPDLSEESESRDLARSSR